MSGLILQYAFQYTDEHRPTLTSYQTMQGLADYLSKQQLVDAFVNYADQNGLKRRNLMIEKSRTLLDQYINSRIIYNILDETAWTQYLNLTDKTVSKALEVLHKHEAFPQPQHNGKGK